MTSSPLKPSVAIDYSVLDHLRRLQYGTYAGSNEEFLARLYEAASKGRVQIWMSEICFVEALHGLENLVGDEAKRAAAEVKDTQKWAIAKEMGTRKLGYPCSKLDDTYSRLGLSFRCAGPKSKEANLLEARLLRVDGVSPGDARQLVSCAYPFDGEATEWYEPAIDWFLAEDKRLVAALDDAAREGDFPELRKLCFGSARTIVDALPQHF